jgi:hypothetical protein
MMRIAGDTFKNIVGITGFMYKDSRYNPILFVHFQESTQIAVQVLKDDVPFGEPHANTSQDGNTIESDEDFYSEYDDLYNEQLEQGPDTNLKGVSSTGAPQQVNITLINLSCKIILFVMFSKFFSVQK